MSDTNAKQAQTVLSLAVNPDSMKQLKTCFLQEPSDVQEMLKKMAKKNERVDLVEYANWLFLDTLEKQYKIERTKYILSRVELIKLVVDSGGTREKALASFDITEDEISAIATAASPKKGSARKLASIQNLLK